MNSEEEKNQVLVEVLLRMNPALAKQVDDYAAQIANERIIGDSPKRHRAVLELITIGLKTVQNGGK